MKRLLVAAMVAVAVAAAATAGAARVAAARADHVRATVVGDHGVKVGAVVPHLALACQDAPAQSAGSEAVQLITFSTPQDCSACSEHLAGLETLAVHAKLPMRDFVVVWAPGNDLEREVAHLRGRMHRNLCLDRAGDLWDRLDISHTPFTILVRKDTVVYMNDSPLTRAANAADFLHDVDLLSRDNDR